MKNKYRYRKLANMYREIGRIEGIVILRYKGAAPFIVSEKELASEFFDTTPSEPPIILERRKTVRAKRPVQQTKRKMLCRYEGFCPSKNDDALPTCNRKKRCKKHG